MAAMFLTLPRRCGKCRILKSENDFPKKPNGKHVSYCRPCGNTYSHARHAKLRAQVAQTGVWEKWRHVTKEEYLRAFAARATLKRRFGITVNDFCDLMDRQQGRCAICGLPEQPRKNLAVDHCHETGAVRGLLCMKCNLGIGHLDDKIALLEAAITYLRNSA